jgi:hypothetical protein
MTPKRTISTSTGSLASLALAVVVLAVVPAAASSPITKPGSGTYLGSVRDANHGEMSLLIGGKSIQLVSFRFACDGAAGAGGIEQIPMKKGKHGWRFRIYAYASIEYSDDGPPENAPVTIGGQFTPSGKRASGHLSVETSRCHPTDVEWRVHRHRSG